MKKNLLFSIITIVLSQLLAIFLLKDFTLSILIAAIIAIILIIWKSTILGLYLVLFLPIFGEFSRFEVLGKSIVASDIIIPIFIFIWIIKELPKIRNFLSKNFQLYLSIAVLFFFFAAFSLSLALISLPINEVISSSLYLIRLIDYFSLVPITYFLLKQNNSLSKLLKIIAISVFLIALGGYIQLEIMPDLKDLALNYGYDPHIDRLVGTWLDPNFLGGFFAFMICIFTSILLYLKDRKYQILTTFLIVFLLIALFLTYSRSAYLALAAGIFIIGLLKSRKLLILTVITACLGISVSERAQQRVGELITSITSVAFNTAENPDPTARLRIENWNQTISLIQEKPIFGHGYNTLIFEKLNKGFVKEADNHAASGSDSSMLTILATTGIIGLTLYLLLTFYPLVLATKIWFKKPNSKNSPLLYKSLSLGFISGLPALIVHSNFVNSLLFPQIMIFYFVFVAIIFYLYDQYEQKI